MLAPEIERDLNALVDEHRRLTAAVRLERYLTPLNRRSLVESLRELPRGAPRRESKVVFDPMPRDARVGLLTFLDRVDPALSVWHGWLHKDVTQTIALVGAIERHDAADITGAATAIWGTPDKATIELAKHLLDEKRDINESAAGVTAQDMARLLHRLLCSAGLSEWRVALDHRMNSRLSVNAAERRIRVRGDARFQDTELRRMVLHEVGTHVVRSENGARQRLRVLGLGLADYLLTEEGLATWHEDHYGVSDPDVMRRYAGRALAVELAAQLSLAETVEELSTWLGREEAIEVALRVKRGIADTGAPGAYTKDHAYLSGYISVKAHLTAHPADHDLLLAGKTSLQQMESLRALERDSFLTPPWLRPEQFLLEV